MSRWEAEDSAIAICSHSLSKHENVHHQARRVDTAHLRIHISNSPRPQLHHGLRSRKSLRLRRDFRVIKGFTGSCDVKTKDVEIKGAIMAAFLRLPFCYLGVIVKVGSAFHYSVSQKKIDSSLFFGAGRCLFIVR